MNKFIQSCCFEDNSLNFYKLFKDITNKKAELLIKSQSNQRKVSKLNKRRKIKCQNNKLRNMYYDGEEEEEEEQQQQQQQKVNEADCGDFNPYDIDKSLFYVKDYDDTEYRFWFPENDQIFGSPSLHTIKGECYSKCFTESTPFKFLNDSQNPPTVEDAQILRSEIDNVINNCSILINDKTLKKVFRETDMKQKRNEQRIKFLKNIFDTCRLGHQHDPDEGFYVI